MSSSLCAGVHVCCNANQLSPLLGPRRQGEAPAGPSPATPTGRPGRPVMQPLSRISHHMDWQPCCSSRTLASSERSTGLLLQLTITGDSGKLQEEGFRGLEAPLFCCPSFHFVWGTYLNTIFAFLKCYNYSSNLKFMFGWSGLHRVLRMTH